MPAVCDEGTVPDTDPFTEVRDAGDVNSKLHFRRKGPQALTSPGISSTPAPERLTPTGVTTNPSGGRKKIQSQGQRGLPRASLADHITMGRKASSGAPSPNLPDQNPCLGGGGQWEDSPACDCVLLAIPTPARSSDICRFRRPALRPTGVSGAHLSEIVRFFLRPATAGPR